MTWVGVQPKMEQRFGMPTSKINWGRVVLGGLLAGVILNAADITFHWVLGGGNWWFFKAFNRPVQEAIIRVFPFVGLRLLVGIAALWLYAAVRPRFGAGPRTAAYAGFAYWVIGLALPTVIFFPLLGGFSTPRMWIIATMVGLLNIVAAAIVGAWLYKE